MLPINASKELTPVAQISVVIPAYNGTSRYLKEAIDSVRAQTLAASEIIVKERPSETLTLSDDVTLSSPQHPSSSPLTNRKYQYESFKSSSSNVRAKTKAEFHLEPR